MRQCGAGSFCAEWHTGTVVTSGTPSKGSRDGRHARWPVIAALFVVVLGGALVAARFVGIGGSSALSTQELERMRAEFDSEIPDGFEAQRLVAQDGEIDPSELLHLAENASNCSLMAGSRPISVELGKWGLTWSINFGRDEENVEDLMVISDRCWDGHVGAAEMQYSNQVAAR